MTVGLCVFLVWCVFWSYSGRGALFYGVVGGDSWRAGVLPSLCLFGVGAGILA